MGGHYSMRRMQRSELDLVVRWAADEGWNPGLLDADAFFTADPSGFFVGTLDGEVIASISVVSYDASYAFLGFYIVRPEVRGRGYGLRLWEYALAQSHARTIGLDGVVAQIPAYERAGFALAHRNVRCVTESRGAGPSAPASRPIEDADLAAVIEYDGRVFGAPRAAFTGSWLTQAGVHSRVHVDAGSVTGYGAIRPATEGFRIGPLFADSPTVAEGLLSDLLGAVPPGVEVAIDVPTVNDAAVRLVHARRMRAEFETARMYLGPAPAAPMHDVYGVTSFELG
ncbi:GNAT family N-acetyltransferase [Agromyces silvae]|uniref:GNAT family N-acetyltransferase n=1 Tax=Agromyces silvae TaxID=3388266 RepID=UPI00280B360A|nr:GNAT family N-acetyltransferase [Agromyces protaetiae]